MSVQVLLAEYTTIKQSVWLRGNKAQSFSTKPRSPKKGEKKLQSGIPTGGGGRRDGGGGWLGYKRRPVGVSDCKVDSIIYSAMVNIPSASRHGQFLDV